MKKIISLLVVFLMMGQLSEIKEQKLKYGDYIQQIAIVNVVNNSISYTFLCEDCTATISVKKVSDNSNVLVNKNMTKIDVGMFGYYALPKDFTVNTQYRAVINTSSPTWGYGYAPTLFSISNETQAVTVRSDSSSGGGLGVMDGLTDILKEAYDKTIGVFLNNISEAFDDNYLGFKTALTGFLNIFGSIFSIIQPIINFFVWFINGLVSIVSWIFTNPKEYIYLVVLSNILGVLAFFIIPIVFIEFAILAHVLIKNEEGELNLFTALSGLGKGNYEILKFISIIFSRIITLITRVLDLIPTT